MPPTRNALRDVDPIALTLCKQGANRQRIFLRKTTTAEKDLLTLPAGRMPILKQGTDWTVFYCVQPEARVLTRDLHWVRAEDLSAGDALWAFDEHRPDTGNGRCWRASEVLSCPRIVRPSIQFTTDDGLSLVVSEDHRWLVRRPGNHAFEWMQTKDLRPGHEISRPVKPWTEDRSWEGGWLSGFFDGEGCVSRNASSVRLTAAQKPGIVMDRARTLLAAGGFDFSLRGLARDSGVQTIGHLGGLSALLACLGTYRPARLIDNLDLDGRRMQNHGGRRAVVRTVESVGEQELIALGTTTATFICEGLASHNCVVAEPGAEEDPGLVGDQDSVDVWLDADEIRKAAHRLLKNAAFVNTEHDGPADPGCVIVESAVALADLTVDGATIREGSWYVGIEPTTSEVRKQIEDGDIEAISLEGTGVRVPLEKSSASDITVTIPAADVGDPATMIRHLAHELDVRKAASFGEVIGAQQLRDMLWRATSTLEEVIFGALRDDDEPDPRSVIRRSLDEFVAFLAPMLDQVQGDSRQGLAKQLATLGSTGTGTADQENHMGLAEDVAALQKSHEEANKAVTDQLKKSDETTGALIGLVGKLTERVEALAAGGSKSGDGDGDKTTVKKTDAVSKLGELCDKLDGFDAELKKVAADVAALGEGGSSQRDDDDVIRVAKTNGKGPLAGLLD